MAIELYTYADQTITPMLDAIIQDASVGRSGILHGMGVATSGSNTLHISAGYGVIKGRLFAVTSTNVTVTLPSNTSYGVLYIKLDLSNSSSPIQILTSISTSGYYSVSQDDDANYNDSVYEMELARFRVSSSAISGLTPTGTRIPYNRTPVYADPSEFAYDNADIFDIWLYMAEHSIGIFSSTDVSSDSLPTSGSVGTYTVFKADHTHGYVYFHSRSTTGSDWRMFLYAYSSTMWLPRGIWERVPKHADVFYETPDTVMLYVNGAGYLTSSNTAVVFSIPVNKLTDNISSATVFDSSLTIRQNGNYLLGTATVGEPFESSEVTVRSNMFSVVGRMSSGFGGVNNGVVSVAGWVQLSLT